MKMHIDKSDHEDDRLLLDLLKQANLEEPSEQFVDNTIKAFLAQRNFTTFRIVKAPLILMAGICVLLFLPFLHVEWSDILASDSIPGIYDFGQDITVEFSIWYLVLPTLLLLTLILAGQIGMRTIIFQNFTK